MTNVDHWPPKPEIRSRGSRSERATAPILVLVVTALVGCGSDEDTGSSPTDPPASTTSAPTTTMQPPDISSTIAGADEEVFGWLRSLETRDGATILEVDPAEMLTGDEALAAARQDGVIGDDLDLPNDYYIRNPDESTSAFTLSPDVVVTLQACYDGGDCVTTEQVDLETWSVLLEGEEDPGLEWNWYGQAALPYQFTVANDLIVRIEEVFLP